VPLVEPEAIEPLVPIEPEEAPLAVPVLVVVEPEVLPVAATEPVEVVLPLELLVPLPDAVPEVVVVWPLGVDPLVPLAPELCELPEDVEPVCAGLLEKPQAAAARQKKEGKPNFMVAFLS
jgi:hypothetical protein